MQYTAYTGIHNAARGPQHVYQGSDFGFVSVGFWKRARFVENRSAPNAGNTKEEFAGKILKTRLFLRRFLTEQPSLRTPR